MTADAERVPTETHTLTGGCFIMGADHGRRDERPAHRVHVRPFRAALRPITNAEYRRFTQDTQSAAPPFWGTPGFDLDDAPVVGISWTDARDYCAWLTVRTGTTWRLPSEAEREYAARGGIVACDWPIHDRAEPASDWPEASARSRIAALEHPHVPTSACRNGFGLYCMADNVHEWCSDWYDRRWYGESPAFAPTGPPTGVRRASRGGSWRHKIKFTRVSARSSLNPSFRYNDYGFRIYADAD